MDMRVQLTPSSHFTQEPGDGHDSDVRQGLHGHHNLEFDLVLEVLWVLLVVLVKDEEVGGSGECKVQDQCAHVGEDVEGEGLAENVVGGEGVEGEVGGPEGRVDILGDGGDGEGRGGGGRGVCEGEAFRP